MCTTALRYFVLVMGEYQIHSSFPNLDAAAAGRLAVLCEGEPRAHAFLLREPCLGLLDVQRQLHLLEAADHGMQMPGVVDQIAWCSHL